MSRTTEFRVPLLEEQASGSLVIREGSREFQKAILLGL